MSESKAVQLFFAYILMAVGGLIAALCGGCTLVFLGFDAWSAVRTLSQNPVFPRGSYASGAAGVAGVILVVGGLPTLIGVTLFFSGLKMKRLAEGPSRRDVDKTFL